MNSVKNYLNGKCQNHLETLYALCFYGKFLLQVDEWPWVKFYEKAKKNTWHMNTIRHCVLPSDVVKTLLPPDVAVVGTRVLYIFDGKYF